MNHLFLALVVVSSSTRAQVSLDRAIQFTGTTDQRGAEGIAMPTADHAALIVEASLGGTVHWADASIQDTVITLTQEIPVAEYREGLLLRFLAPANTHGAFWLRCGTLPALPLHRTDGLHPANGQLLEGRVMEVMLLADHWVLLNAPEIGCPPGFLMVNERLCVERNDSPLLRYDDAQIRCVSLGGKLCRWDEAYLACMTMAPLMQGLFNGWEWLDETANHTHTAVQFGQTSCESQRSVTLPTLTAQVRCCFYPR